MPELLGDLLANAAARRPDHPAVRTLGSTVSFRELERDANAVAHLLLERGIRAGDRVALYAINSPEFVTAYFAILKCGATVVPVNLLLHPNEAAYVIEDSGAVALVAHAAVAGNLAPIADSILGRLKTVALTAPCEGFPGADVFPEPDGDVPPPARPDLDPAEDVAAILYTSGTTGRPKGAMLTHRNLLFDVRAVADVLHTKPDDVFVAVLPMFHAFSATCCMLLPIDRTCTIAAAPRFHPEELASLIRETRATIFMGVPSMYAVFANAPEGRAPDLSTLRVCISGGAAMPEEILRRFEERYGVTIYEGDGPTECSPVTSVNPPGGLRKIGSIGPPIPGVEMRIADDRGEELPIGEIGEILVRGPNVMKGYHNRPEETAEVFVGDWLRTGDLGRMDDDGYFYIVDRKKDLIIVNGMNVYPRVVEEAIYEHPAVAECAVVPAPHKLHGEIPRAVIVLREGSACTPAEIRAHCRERLGRHEIPRIIEFVEALPKSATGKILKRELL